MTRKQFENDLNYRFGRYCDGILVKEAFIIGGRLRTGQYGTMLRKHNPVAFEVAYEYNNK